VHPPVKWRDTSPAGLAAWANMTLSERVLDLLANISFAVEEIRQMLEVEDGLGDVPRLDASLVEIQSRTDSLILLLARQPAPLDLDS
jgi:hypothetical protein